MAKKTNTKNGAKGRMQTFSFQAPAAMSVQLVGDFTQWQECPISLQRKRCGWRGRRTAVPPPPGTNAYNVSSVDGEWRDDPECTLHTPNPFGGENMTRQGRREAAPALPRPLTPRLAALD